MLLIDRWYAVQVRSRCEKVVAQLLEEKGYVQFLPWRRLRRRRGNSVATVEQPLFPNYVFCRVTATVNSPIVTTRGVVRIVGAGNQPVPVHDHEIEALQRIATSMMQPLPWHAFAAGQKVRIDSGPLCGLEGMLCRCGTSNRVVVSVSLLQRAVAVEIDGDAVTALGDSWPVAAIA